MVVLGQSTSLDDALLAMQQARIHVALIADGAAHTLGIATLEDVIEALVGDIRDESDR
jgi:CBS domain containing-hemolysin-like protein